MDRHFLIAVSEQKSALFGVRFVGNFFSDKQSVKTTLFYCTPRPPAIWEKERTLETDSRQKEQARQIVIKGEAALETAKKECVHLGLPLENIFLKQQIQEFSKVTDIIQEGEKGSYDAVVLGRRGLSMLEAAFEESVSKDLFSQSFTFPVWLCRSSEANRKNVLLYVDGSETSFRMADHAGFVVSLEKRHRIDILVSEETKDAVSVMGKCKTILLNHGIPETLIRQHPATSGNAAKTILQASEKERYAAVALGCFGESQGLLTRLFKSPVCAILFKELQGAALWICR